MTFELPPLPYEVSALEPYIDSRTLFIHHDMHHAAYVKALNLAMKSAPDLQDKTAKWLLLNLNRVPDKIRTAVRNNAGGHVNHSLFWKMMSPSRRGGGETPSGPLATAIDDAFESFEKFKTRFEEAGNTLFGSGWVWLVKALDGDKKLRVITTTGHDNPITQGFIPLLVNDVWEHAYYLKHENRRDEYLRSWWAVTNWKEADNRFEMTDQTARLDWEDEGGMVIKATK